MNSFENGYKNRLTDRVFKLIPLREDRAEWLPYLDSLLIELAGLQERYPSINMHEIISKLAIAKFLSWKYYKKSVFECCTLIGKLDFPEEG